MKKVLAIIVARQGSKGLSSKCMLPICNMPVVEHVITWANSLACKDIDVNIIVSSDIIELEAICKKHGVSWRKRPSELANDVSYIEDVVMDAALHSQYEPDYLFQMYGNVPVRHDRLFYDPLEFLEDHQKFDAVLSFQKVEKFNPEWMVACETDRLPQWDKSAHRRQDLKPYMIHDGHTILMRSDHFLKFWPHRDQRTRNQMYEAYGFVIKPWLHNHLVIDIDTENDYILAKAYLESGRYGNQSCKEQ
jgi:CMP-N,N'-diacetyllegionaminic acid synthase